MDQLHKGAFTVHLTEGNGHAVGLDEAHEMCINKDSKYAVVRPSPDMMEKIANFMPFRSKCLNNLKRQLSMEKQPIDTTLPIATSRDRIADVNIEAMLDMMEESGMIGTEKSEAQLRNPFTSVVATPEQQNDLLTFRKTGQMEYENYISYRILHTPSTNAPCRRKRLQTFSTAKSTQKKIKQIDKDHKLFQTCMKKQLVLYNRGEQLPPACSLHYIPRPSALCDSDGSPNKGNKSKTTDFFETRYKKCNVIVSTFPGSWTPETVILEGMFLIQTTPPPSVITFRHYTNMLLKRFVCPHLNAGVKEVHILYDDPNYSQISPKLIERQKRDQSMNIDTSHECLKIESSTPVPSDWRGKLLNCRMCKRALCAFLSHDMLSVAVCFLNENQIFFTAGGFDGNHRNKCLCIRKGGTPMELPFLSSNAEETDLRIMASLCSL